MSVLTKIKNRAVVKPPLIFGEVLFDEFTQDDKVVKKVLGGAPLNVAWNLKNFSLSPLFVSAVGDDANGKKILQTLQEADLHSDGISLSAYATGSVQIILKKGEPSYRILSPAAYDDIAWPQKTPDSFSFLYHGSLALRHAHNQELLQFIKQKYKLPIFFDVNLRKPWYQKEKILAWVKDADWLKLNEEEFAELFFPLVFSHDFPAAVDEKDSGGNAPFGEQVLLPRQTKKIFSLLKIYNLKALVITLGSRGAVICEPENIYAAPAPAVKNFQDAVGAGDAFASVFLLGTLLQKNTKEILHSALAFASLICGTRGALYQEKSYYKTIIEKWGQDDEN